MYNASEPRPLARRRTSLAGALVIAAGLAGQATHAVAQEKVLNVYSARHYQTDEQLYGGFTKLTGVKINRIEMGDQPLLERLKAEGDRSPAAVVLLVDATRLTHAQREGLFQPVDSKVLTERIPQHFRASDNSWFGFSSRARVIGSRMSRFARTRSRPRIAISSIGTMRPNTVSNSSASGASIATICTPACARRCRAPSMVSRTNGSRSSKNSWAGRPSRTPRSCDGSIASAPCSTLQISAAS